MKEDYEETGLVPGALMPHCLSSGEVRVRTRSDDPAVGLESPFDDDDRVCGGVRVQTTLHADRVADEVQLLSRVRILVEQAQANRLIVDRCSSCAGILQLQRAELIDNGCLAVRNIQVLSVRFSTESARPPGAGQVYVEPELLRSDPRGSSSARTTDFRRDRTPTGEVSTRRLLLTAAGVARYQTRRTR